MAKSTGTWETPVAAGKFVAGLSSAGIGLLVTLADKRPQTSGRSYSILLAFALTLFVIALLASVVAVFLQVRLEHRMSLGPDRESYDAQIEDAALMSIVVAALVFVLAVSLTAVLGIIKAL